MTFSLIAVFVTRLHVGVCVLGRQGHGVRLHAKGTEAAILVLSGEPIDEPIAAQGPFVMNTRAEIEQVIVDFRSGRMGRIQHHRSGVKRITRRALQ